MRVTVIVLDSFGIGAAPDAALYGDEGTNTIKSAVIKGGAKLENLCSLGLSDIDGVDCLQRIPRPSAVYARMREISAGKDTTTGHWEMMGAVIDKPFPTYPNGFPAEIITQLENAFGRRIIGNRAESGTEIIKELGETHLKTGDIIVYTSADSVLQIAAHTDIISLEELYSMCKKAREIMTGRHAVGRIIARPFEGAPGAFVRRKERHDFSLQPPTTLLNILKDKGFDVIGVGKINDIFNGSGLTESFPVKGNKACMQETLKLLDRGFNGLLFVNLVDFDMLYGHRNDCAGYAAALEEFDAALPALLQKTDELIITADHGCDPGTPGTDHTREYVPVLVKCRASGNRGTVEGFGCVAATVAKLLNTEYQLHGKSLI